jgi:hypothetical protein
MWASTGTWFRMDEIGSKRAEFSAAEEGGEEMALKIFTGAKPFLKADIMLFASASGNGDVYHTLKLFGLFINIGNEW